jgi:lambda family phage portal protein
MANLLNPLNWFKKKITRTRDTYKGPRQGSFGMEAADVGRLFDDWDTNDTDINYAMAGKMSRVRNRSRDMEMNNAYFLKFLSNLESDVIGDNGIGYQMQYGKDRKNITDAEKKINEAIEEAFYDWGDNYCTVDDKFDLPSMERMAIRTVARDGEVILKIIRGPQFNKYGFTLQMVPSEYLDEEYNTDSYDWMGNKVKTRLGIQFDLYNRPIRYFFSINGRRESFPASDIIHYFIPLRIDQARGLPWVHASLSKLRMHHAYEFNEVVASRAAACKMAMMQKQKDAPGELSGGSIIEEEGTTDGDKKYVEELEPAKIGLVPPGYEMKDYNPTHPNANFSDFSVTILHGVAAGLGQTYQSLTGDLRWVNFSSIRAGLLKERDIFKILQAHMKRNLMKRLFREFMAVALFTELKKVPFQTDYSDYMKWNPRRWPWVDPLKDVQAKKEELQNGFTTYTDILGEQGRDFTDTISALKKEVDTIESLGLSLPLTTVSGGKGKTEEKPGDGTDDDPTNSSVPEKAKTARKE